jgi:hypothetical protein
MAKVAISRPIEDSINIRGNIEVVLYAPQTGNKEMYA